MSRCLEFLIIHLTLSTFLACPEARIIQSLSMLIKHKGAM